MPKTTRLVDCSPIAAEVLEVGAKHEDGNENDGKTDNLNEQIDGVHDFGVGTLILFRLRRKLADVGILADFIYSCRNLTARHKRACVKERSVFLFNGYGFTRQEGFVQLCIAL